MRCKVIAKFHICAILKNIHYLFSFIMNINQIQLIAKNGGGSQYKIGGMGCI